jgi:5-hydroxyisourate hydrolase-like protein (transthyretin family)
MWAWRSSAQAVLAVARDSRRPQAVLAVARDSRRPQAARAVARDSRRPQAIRAVARDLCPALAACVLAAVLSAQNPTQAVDGHVVNAATGAGIPGVAVSLIPAGAPQAKSAYSATTDPQGRFHIENAKDGTYTASYKAPGFFPIPNIIGGNQPPFHLTGASDPVHLEIKMQPIGKLSGRVLDATGKPVPGATVWLHWETSQCQMPICIGFSHQAKSDDRGEYSVTSFEVPGAWLVSATPPASWPQPESTDDRRLGWAQTYYPGVTDPQLAARVVTGGDLLLDIKLAAVPVHRIHGVVLDLNGAPAPKVAVTLTKGVDAPAFVKDTNADGVFEFESIPDDEWRVFAKVKENNLTLWASQELHLRDHNLENVELRLTGPFSIHGKVVMEVPEGAAPPGLPKVSGVTLALNAGGRPAEVPGTLLQLGESDATGNFTVQNVYPGPYLIIAAPPPPNYYLDSIRLGDRDAVASDVLILSGAQALTVTYKPGGGTVRGTVGGNLGANVDACGGGDVVLVPQDPALRRAGFIRRTTCAQNGGFEIANVRPGEYYGLAIAGGDPTPWFATTLDDRLLQQASSVSVHANESISAEIRIITR